MHYNSDNSIVCTDNQAKWQISLSSKNCTIKKHFQWQVGRQASKKFIIDISIADFCDLFYCSSLYKIVDLYKKRRKRFTIAFNDSEVGD